MITIYYNIACSINIYDRRPSSTRKIFKFDVFRSPSYNLCLRILQAIICVVRGIPKERRRKRNLSSVHKLKEKIIISSYTSIL